ADEARGQAVLLAGLRLRLQLDRQLRLLERQGELVALDRPGRLLVRAQYVDRRLLLVAVEDDLGVILAVGAEVLDRAVVRAWVVVLVAALVLLLLHDLAVASRAAPRQRRPQQAQHRHRSHRLHSRSSDRDDSSSPPADASRAASAPLKRQNSPGCSR